MLNIFLVILLLASTSTYAEDSPFDVLNAEDRYKAESDSGFDVNEGGDDAAPAVAEQAHDAFDVMHHHERIEAEKAGGYYNVAKIVALNKITAKSQEFAVKVGETVYFGNIAISVQKCWSNNDPYSLQNKILLKIVENRIDDDPQKLFTGWMISSNMQASVMEHPSYEVIAISCGDGQK